MVSLGQNFWTDGCQHFKMCCKIWTPCCNEIYPCHLCHNEKEQHDLDKKDISQLICIKCGELQPLKTHCRYCGVGFAQYTCLICKVFDIKNKGQFHCYECGLCRIGGEENYFHCKKCNMCLALKFLDNHTCVENISRGNCPLCLEDLHTSTIPLSMPSCGHVLHKNCYDKLRKTGHKLCPICKSTY